MVKIIFIDVDGTLLNTKSKLSSKNKKACILAQKAEILIVINTGRYGKNAVKIAEMLNVNKYNGYTIGNDGAEVWSFKENKWIYLSQIARETTKKFLSFLSNYHEEIIINFSCIDGLYINRLYKKWTEWLQHLEIKIIQFHNFNDIKTPISKIIIIIEHSWDAHKTTQFITEFENMFPELSIVQYHTNVFSIGNKNINKGSAVTWLCQKLKIKINNTMAIGDNFNDLSMLEAVHYPIVVENAHEAIKTYAFWVAPSNDHDAVAKAISNFCNIVI